jgi:nucleoside 2-deoxyribosyltransferase
MDKDYFKQYYKENRDIILTRQIGKWKRAYVFLVEQKTKPCIDCGFIPIVPEQMDFDHVRGTKTVEVTRLAAQGKSNERILEEIEKCDLVCANCHRLRTSKRRTLPL